MKESYEFSDLNGEGSTSSRTQLTESGSRPKSGGCRISTAMGFVLALLAILIAVGVGVIVHFASPARKFECHCNYPGGGATKPTPEAQWQACLEMAKENDHCVISDCPGGSPAPESTTSATMTSTEGPTDVPYMRLPTALFPVHYKVELEPRMYTSDPKSFTFQGSVDILLECKKATNNITLHIKELELVNSSISLSSAAGESTSSAPPGIVDYQLDSVREFVVFNLDADLDEGSRYNIRMSFSGPLKNDLRGLYLSAYQENSQSVYLATTQFQSTDARKAFPCFDEPALKATFDITLVRRDDYMALSNMPLISSQPRENGMTADSFNTTTRISTYLLAFVVSKYTGNEMRTQNNVKIGVWSRPEALHQSDYALNLSVEVLDFFQDYYGLDYPLPKLDMAAVPDFLFRGMENWGLIIYRETAMLFDPNVSGSYDKNNVAVVVAHELAHQWFGNLVTPSWWDDLWLNEGFASFAENVGRNHVYPEWHVFEMFIVDQLQRAFRLDALHSSHPIYVPVNHPDEINEIFDSISYNKGASILRMLQHYMGEEKFKQGIKSYLQKHAFGSATHEDLWDALDAAMGGGRQVSIKDMMSTWILQMNYPVVTVTRKPNNAFSISQNRFLLSPDAPESQKYSSPFGYKWDIPFTYTTSLEHDFDTNRRHLMGRNAGEEEITNNAVIPEWNNNNWVIGNVREAGFYRVNYDTENWNALIAQLKNNHTVLPAENRAQIINDAWNLAKADLTEPRVALETVDYLMDEEGYVPWRAATIELGYVDSQLERTGLYGSFKKYMASLLNKQYKRVGWEKTSGNFVESLMQTLIIGQACHYDLADCVTHAKKLFADWMKDSNTNPVPPEMKGAVYCTAIANGGQQEWDFAFNMYQKANVATEKDTLLASLACSRETWILSRYLHKTLDTSLIPRQNALSAIASISLNPAGRGLAWDFTRQNWDVLMERYGSGVSLLPRLIDSVTSSFNTEFELQQIKDLVGKNPDLGTAKGAFEQAIEKVEANIKWMEKMEDVVQEWLENKDKPDDKVTDVRLPTSLSPLEYHVELKPDFYGDDPEAFSLQGSVTIRMECKEATNNITLHINKLTVDPASLTVQNAAGVDLPHDTPREDKDRQFYIIPLPQNLTPGQEYIVTMHFTGPLKDDLRGLYLSQYKRDDQTVYMATTQFQPTDARKAFPCFDEPALKAEFNIILLRKPDRISLSNMPIVRTVNRPDGFVADVYQKTVKMSTYLLAFIICDFTYREKITDGNTTYRVYARPEAIDQAEYALETGVKILQYFETYFNISFPLPKLDMIAIPDFSAGAMENWGLITYRETAMLYDPLTSSEGNKERVAIVVSHELAHMWFGNLVTPSWWDDLWLNEGFATFVEYIGVDHAHPDWKMHDTYVQSEVHRAFQLDGLVTSHPLYAPVNHPDEIYSIFDSISYSKGAAVINMIKAFLGEKTFLKGLQNYLVELSFDAAFHDDLWDALTKQATADGNPVDVKDVMDTWILQMNYPVVTFSRSPGAVVVSQQRYLQDPSAQDTGKYPSPYGYTWEVPVTFTSDIEMDFTNSRVHWLRRDQTNITISNPNILPPENDGLSWVIGNVRQNCYYRVNYDMTNWEALIKQLKRDHTKIDPVNRAQIISDSWSLAKSGQLDQRIALRTIEYLENEDEDVPFSTALTELNYVRRMLKKTGTFGALRAFMAMMISPLYMKMGWDNTNATHLETYMRWNVLSVACTNEHKDCVMQAKKLFADWMADEDNNPIDRNFKSIVYCTAIAHGGVEEWDFAYRMYKKANVASEAVRLQTAMSCSQEPWILTRYLERTLIPEEIRKQDAVSCITSISANAIGQSLAWDFVRANWDYMMTTYGAGSFSASRLVRGITNGFNTEFQLQQLEEFMKKYPDQGSAASAFAQAMENIRSNINWLKNNEKIIADWLKEQDMDTGKVTDVRLPLNVYPIHYDLELKPDMYGLDPAAFTFEGSVKILVNCTQPTMNVTLHVNKLELSPVTFVGMEGCATPQIVDQREDKERQFLVVTFTSELQPGCRYTLATNFTGPLKDDLAGLYLSSYVKGNETVYIATSQLQPTDARKTFPCFDEPAIKATFSVTLWRKPHMKSLSNMPIVATENRTDGYLADIYQKTPKMSTYLLAFIVCDFAMKNGTTKGGTTYRVWAREEAIDQADHALDVGIKILDYFEEFFNLTYPLPKQDMIAIPDFGAGAMENWGLITYRETAMLYDPNVSAESNKQRVAVVVSHELAHQWFGNLVTPSWWDDLWLNEGFASYVEYIGVEFVKPTWKMFEQFVTADLQYVFDFDSLTSSHPVYVPVAHPDEINEIFDRISYSKGASVIRMMRFFLGDETFRKGLTKYLTRRKYDAAFHDDLWQALTEQSQEDAAGGAQVAWDVKEIMDTWTLQMNYPIVTLNRTGQQGGSVRVSQSRFLWDYTAPEDPRYPSPFNYSWNIPLTIVSSESPDFTTRNIYRMNRTEGDKIISYTSAIPADQSNSWIIGNAKQFGYYRVNYDTENWISLIRQLNTNHTVIDPINRAQIINDAWNLAKAGWLDLTVALDTIGYLSQEESYVPWVAADRELSNVDLMLSKSASYGAFSSFMKNMSQAAYSKLDWQVDGDHLNAYIREIVFGLACDYGVEDCVRNATELFTGWMNDPSGQPVKADLKSFVYCTAIREGGIMEWNFAYSQYKQSGVASEKARLLSAMGCSSDIWILNRYLERALDQSEIRRQDAVSTIIYVSRNPIGRLMVWDFFVGKWDVLLESYGGGSFSFSRLIGAVTQSFNTAEELEKLEKFMADHPNQGSGARAFQQAVEKTKSNIDWMNKNFDLITDWLDSRGFRS